MRKRIRARLRRWWREAGRDYVVTGLVCSLAAHALVIAVLMLFRLTPKDEPHGAQDSPLVVELVEFGDGLDVKGVPADAKPAAPLAKPKLAGSPHKGEEAPDNVG